MIAFEIEELARLPEWPQVLAHYNQQHTAARQQNPEFNGWLERLLDCEGLTAERLSKVHGKLIAFGLLKIQLIDRNVGLHYQLSPEGRRALAQHTGVAWQADGDTEPEESEE